MSKISERIIEIDKKINALGKDDKIWKDKRLSNMAAFEINLLLLEKDDLIHGTHNRELMFYNECLDLVEENGYCQSEEKELEKIIAELEADDYYNYEMYSKRILN